MENTSVALYMLSWLLNIVFLRFGLEKLTSSLFPRFNQQTRRNYEHYATVFPTAFFGYKPSPDGYMFVIGIIETLASFLLLLPYSDLQNWIYLVFCVRMALAIYTHDVLEEYIQMAFAICLFLASVVLYKVGPVTLTKQD